MSEVQKYENFSSKVNNTFSLKTIFFFFLFPLNCLFFPFAGRCMVIPSWSKPFYYYIFFFISYSVIFSKSLSFSPFPFPLLSFTPFILPMGGNPYTHVPFSKTSVKLHFWTGYRNSYGVKYLKFCNPTILSFTMFLRIIRIIPE